MKEHFCYRKIALGIAVVNFFMQVYYAATIRYVVLLGLEL